MTPDQEERLVAAFEQIAEAFDYLAGSIDHVAKTAAEFQQKSFPARRNPEPATITNVPTPEELLKQEQGSTGESATEWMTLNEPDFIGPRERDYLAREEAAAKEKAEKEKRSRSRPKTV